MDTLSQSKPYFGVYAYWESSSFCLSSSSFFFWSSLFDFIYFLAFSITCIRDGWILTNSSSCPFAFVVSNNSKSFSSFSIDGTKVLIYLTFYNNEFNFLSYWIYLSFSVVFSDSDWINITSFLILFSRSFKCNFMPTTLVSPSYLPSTPCPVFF